MKRKGLPAGTLAGVVLVILGGMTRAQVRVAAYKPVLRTVHLRGSLSAATVDARTNRVFVAISHGGQDGTVSMLDARSGVVLHTTHVEVVPTDVAADMRTAHVFVLNGTRSYLGDIGSVSMLDARSGRLLRTVPVGYDPFRVAVDESSGRVFVLNAVSNSVSTLDARSGSVLRTVQVGKEARDLVVDEQAGRVFVIHQDNDEINLLDAHSGAVVRAVTVGSTPAASAERTAAVDTRTGHLFVADSGFTGIVRMLDVRSGVVLHTYTTNTLVFFLTMAVDERADHLFVLNFSEHGSVSMLDTRNDHLLHTIPVGPAPEAVAVDERNGRVFVLNGNKTADTTGPSTSSSNVTVLDAGTGRLLHTITVSKRSVNEVGPGTITVDERSGRAFVLNRGDSTVSMLDATY